jgi:hypothetical protein
MARDVCNELRSGLMLVVQVSAKEQIKAFDSQGAQCVFSDLGIDESYAVTKSWKGSRSTCVGLRSMIVHVTRNLPKFAQGNSGAFGSNPIKQSST